jgi:hypothetical protein
MTARKQLGGYVALQHTCKRETFVIGVYGASEDAVDAARRVLFADYLSEWVEVQTPGRVVWETDRAMEGQAEGASS